MIYLSVDHKPLGIKQTAFILKSRDLALSKTTSFPVSLLSTLRRERGGLEREPGNEVVAKKEVFVTTPLF